MKRILSITMFFALMFAGLSIASFVRASDSQHALVTIHAQGNAYHIDFMSVLGKRADLRTAMASKGLDVAFTQWLKAEHPDAYRSAVASFASSLRLNNNDPKSAYAYCCDKSGACCKSGCAQCCAKGECKMDCCTMTACKALRNVCCR